MRHGVVILGDLPWAEARHRWLAAEEMGFDHGWSYDHLVWGGLPEATWSAAFSLLGAVAAVTSRIGLGTAVCSANFRHPYPAYRGVQTLADVSAGRFVLGVGVGGEPDAGILGGPALGVRERVQRFREFTDLLLRLRAEDHVDATGRWFSVRDARTLPAPHAPVIVAGDGPGSIGYAARVGDGWITLGRRSATRTDWFAGLAEQRDVLESALAAAGRDRDGFARYLMLDGVVEQDGGFSLASADCYEDLTGRAAELGFTDVITHWPRAEPPYAGSVAVLEEVAVRLATARAGAPPTTLGSPAPSDR